jgi:hypothetical protein
MQRTQAVSLRRKWLGTLAALVAAFLGERAASAQYLVQGLDGPVSGAEIDAFKSFMKSKLADTSGNGPFNAFVGNRGNNYVYGQSGGALEGIISMYEVSKDPELLDQAVWFADQMLGHRNDRFNTRMIFTGKPELCWPNKLPTDPDAKYCGTEQGDVLGHITAVAKLIAKSPFLWNKTTPVEDKLGYGKTYLERARSYIRECKRSIDTFITPYFVHPTSKRFVTPDRDDYGALGDRYQRARGKTVPWNQNTMLAGGYLNIAEALDLLQEDPATVVEYDVIVKAFTDAFFEKVTKGQAMGNPVYNWSYASDDTGPDYRYPEDLGHGGYDFWGLYKAFVRGKQGISKDSMVAFANTVRYVIMRPNGSFSEKVGGTGGDRPSMGSTWLYVMFFRPDLYKTIAGSLVGDAKGDPDTAGRLLWAKYMSSRNWAMDPPIYGDGGVPAPPPPVADAGAGDAGGAREAGAGGAGGAGSGGAGGGGSGGATGAGGVGGAGGGQGGGGGASGGGGAPGATGGAGAGGRAGGGGGGAQGGGGAPPPKDPATTSGSCALAPAAPALPGALAGVAVLVGLILRMRRRGS